MILRIICITLSVLLTIIGIDVLIMIPDKWDNYKNDILILLSMIILVLILLIQKIDISFKKDKENNNGKY